MPRGTSRTQALDHEIAQEQASALGRLGRALETALKALADHEARRGGHDGQHRGKHDTEHARLLQAASHSLWCFIVQREACGMRDPRPVLSAYRVPAAVQNHMGVCGGTPQRQR
jgi:hypothetical protein